MNLAQTSDVLSIVHNIHAATGHDEQWDVVLSSIRHLLFARVACIAKHQFSTGRGCGIYVSPTDTGINQIYAQHFSVRNPWFLSSSHYEDGRVFVGTDVLRNEELVETDFYQNFLKPNGLFHRLCGVINHKQDIVYYITLLRGEDESEFGDREKEMLACVLQHLTVSLQNHWHLLHVNDMADVLRSAINRFPYATFIVDRCGSVIYRNALSKQFLNEYGALQLTDENVGAVLGVEHNALLQAIREVADAPPENTSDSEKVVTITSPNCEQPILINIHPLGNIYSVEEAETVPVVIMTVRDPNNNVHHPQSCSFAKLFDLTPAQARLSSLVFSGYTLHHAATHLHVSENTLHSHLKQIFQKTHTHGQMELVHLHAKICTDHV